MSQASPRASRDPIKATASVGKPSKRPPRISMAVKFGIPLVFFCVAGYGALSLFVSDKVNMQDSHIKNRSVRSYELEEEHKKVMQTLDLAKLEIKPIPRPKE